jgi:hypothetical protein
MSRHGVAFSAPSPKCCPFWQLRRRDVAPYVQVRRVCEARLASVESDHAIVNHKLSACGGRTFRPLEDRMKAQAGKMHITFAGKMHISFAGKMH